jgi:hypothetical protein
MKITSILSLATAFVAFSTSAHAVEVFSVESDAAAFPTTSAANFNAVDADGNPTNAYNIYNTTDTGNGSGWGGGVTTNFDGVTAVNPGDQKTAGSNTTTYFGPKFYAGVNRDQYQVQAGAIHSNGNGYRIRCNNISATLIGTAQVGTAQVGTAQVGVEGDADYAPASADYVPASADYAAATGNGGNAINIKAIFMFDADTTILSGEGDNLRFGADDTLTAKLALANNMGPGTGTGSVNRASLATYRPMVKADGGYYAGPLYTADLSTLSGANSTNIDVTNAGSTATWTLVPNITSNNNSLNGVAGHPQNLTVDSSASATTVPGYALRGITQVGFLLETIGEENSGGFNYGVREFSANATPANAPDPIEWSEDFTSTVSILDSLDGLTGYGNAYTWARTGGNQTTSDPSRVTQDETNNNVVISITENADAGQAYLSMVGPGTTDLNGQNGAARRVRPVSHETTWEFDLIAFKDGDADLNLQTRGGDGYVKSTISPAGNIKFTTWMADFTHRNFDDFSGPSRLRVNANNSNSGVSIVTGGTFDPLSADPVTITISGNATGTVNMNGAGDAVESITIVDQGSGYIADPTVTFAGGGMTVAPTVSFNYSSGNLNGPVNFPQGTHSVYVDVAADILPNAAGNKNWQLFADGQILTYIQSYDSSDDSLSYYLSLTNKATGEVTGPVLITTLNAADHSPGGHGFFDVTTGNRYTTPNNRDAVMVHYKRYGNADAAVSTIGVNSISVATSDDDGDGVVNRKDAFSTDPLESADSDSDGVGDNSDTNPGYDDSVVATLDAAVQAAGSSTFSYYVSANEDDHSYSTGGGGAITQEVYDAAVAAKDAAEAAQATAESSLANAREARAGSTVIDVANDVATITLTVEETSDLNDWSSGTSSDYDIELSAPAGASFYRFTIPE